MQWSAVWCSCSVLQSYMCFALILQQVQHAQHLPEMNAYTIYIWYIENVYVMYIQCIYIMYVYMRHLLLRRLYWIKICRNECIYDIYIMYTYCIYNVYTIHVYVRHLLLRQLYWIEKCRNECIYNVYIRAKTMHTFSDDTCIEWMNMYTDIDVYMESMSIYVYIHTSIYVYMMNM